MSVGARSRATGVAGLTLAALSRVAAFQESLAQRARNSPPRNAALKARSNPRVPSRPLVSWDALSALAFGAVSIPSPAG